MPKIPAFWQAVLVVVIAYFVFDNAFPPVMPATLLTQYMVITIVGVLLYFSFNDERWAEFLAPMKSVLKDDDKVFVRWGFLVMIPVIVGYHVYDMVRPSLESPVELRQVHPAPPNKLKVFGKTFDLTTLENPVRQDVLAIMEQNPEKARKVYDGAVSAGSGIYYKNCFYCHGDLLDGRGMFAEGLNPAPANFRDIGTIAQLQEAYLFWRISTGGPGLPKEGAPWNSAMPVWHEMLEEQDIWNVIMFLYDHVGHVPRMWDLEVSKSVTALSDEIRQERSQHKGEDLYQDHCSACHGVTGEGDGPASEFLYPKPRDFTLGMFKYKSAKSQNEAATNENLFRTIKDGLPDTGMPAWGSLLSDSEIEDVIKVVKSFDLVGTWAPEEATDGEFDEEGRYLGEPLSITNELPLDNNIAFSEESVFRGQEKFKKICAACHGLDGRGNPGASKRLKDDWGNRIWPRDLTQPWTWRATEVTSSREETIKNIFTRLSVGIPGTPMPEHATTLTSDVRWDIANFVYTLRRDIEPPSKTRVVQGLRIDSELPDKAEDAAWTTAPKLNVRVMPNIIKGKRLFKPLNSNMTVRTLFNEHDVAIMLEFDDRTMSRPGDADAEKTQDRKLELYPDAFAIQFPKKGSYTLEPTAQKPLFRHGDDKHPTTMWYWNVGSVEPDVSPYAAILDASGEKNAVQPRMGEIDLQVNGEWVNGRWRVIFKHPRVENEAGDLGFAEGQFIPISFANWDGSNSEKGSKHKLTTWYWLYLPAPTNALTTYGLPLAVWFVLVALGLLFGWLRRRSQKSEQNVLP